MLRTKWETFNGIAMKWFPIQIYIDLITKIVKTVSASSNQAATWLSVMLLTDTEHQHQHAQPYDISAIRRTNTKSLNFSFCELFAPRISLMNICLCIVNSQLTNYIYNFVNFPFGIFFHSLFFSFSGLRNFVMLGTEWSRRSEPTVCFSNRISK